MLKGKKIILGITGSIAAYKAVVLTRLLIKTGCEVRVVMTPSAAKFISPLTLSTLSKNKVVCAIVESDSWTNHVEYGLWADLFLIAPASANTLAKMAHGLCDNMLMAVYLSVRCPVLISPAMDEDMWKHPATQKNIEILKSFHHHILPVEHGELASGLIGPGRMAEPDDIMHFIENFLSSQKKLHGIKALVGLGPTVEPIDAVRVITNRSSGKMGIALVNVLINLGAEVTVVSGPVSEVVPKGASILRVQTAQDMYEAMMHEFPKNKLIIMAAAVSDYTVEKPSAAKIKKKADSLTLNLIKTKDILRAMGLAKTDPQVLVGFALETDNEEANAIDKLEKKNADYIILNSLQDAGAGFSTDTNKVTIYSKKHKPVILPLQSKSELSAKIIEYLIAHENL